MALKRRHKIEAGFSMASMTDVIFLLLIFFMITSTIVFPNSIKVDLPQSVSGQAPKQVPTITIDDDLKYFITIDNNTQEIPEAQLSEQLGQKIEAVNGERQATLQAGKQVPYEKIVRVLDAAQINNIQIALATKPVQNP